MTCDLLLLARNMLHSNEVDLGLFHSEPLKYEIFLFLNIFDRFLGFHLNCQKVRFNKSTAEWNKNAT